MIVLDNILKICIKLIKLSNDSATEKFYSLWMFRKVEILVKVLKFSKKRNSKEKFRGRSCSTSYSSGNQVDGSPLVAIIMTRRVEVFFLLEK